MIKKILALFLLALCIIFIFCISSFAADEISLVINNKKVECEVPPVIFNDRTLVPVRVLFEHYDAKVRHDGALLGGRW